MNDAIVISDLHLGADICQAKAVRDFLDSIERKTAKLILNGDVFDSLDFRRLKKHHWGVLSKIRSLSDRIEVVWIHGNHDGSSEIVSHLLGIPVMDQYVLTSADKQFLVLHGHVFDQFIVDYPLLTSLGDYLYRQLQRLDSSHTWARVAKRNSKQYLRCKEKIKRDAVEYSTKSGYDGVICGHVHSAEIDEEVGYYNSGCWTELTCNYLAVRHGEITLRNFPA